MCAPAEIPSGKLLKKSLQIQIVDQIQPVPVPQVEVVQPGSPIRRSPGHPIALNEAGNPSLIEQ